MNLDQDRRGGTDAPVRREDAGNAEFHTRGRRVEGLADEMEPIAEGADLAEEIA